MRVSHRDTFTMLLAIREPLIKSHNGLYAI
jgi:hypothetical protein